MTELVEIAFVGDEHQAAMIQALLEQNGIPSLQQQVAPSGPQLGEGLMNFGGGSRRVMVHPERFAEARAVLFDAMGEVEHEAPEPVNARYLEEGQSGRKRLYGTRGALVRMYLFIFGLMALSFGGFMLARLLGFT
ncbi:MAG: DUF2007 domain-containing protein [Actinomycetota bacterium]|nr:DUF2007 domain-containing protein [Actinomycetota bacterium]